MKTYKLLNIGRYCSAAAVFTFMLFVGDMLMQTIKKLTRYEKHPCFQKKNPETQRRPNNPDLVGKSQPW